MHIERLRVGVWAAILCEGRLAVTGLVDEITEDSITVRAIDHWTGLASDRYYTYDKETIREIYIEDEFTKDENGNKVFETLWLNEYSSGWTEENKAKGWSY